jgi:DNA-damage-inducible protein J
MTEMRTVQLATRLDEDQDRLFRETARRLGTTPADAMRVFVAAFNAHRGFPFDVRLSTEAKPFETEEEADEFVGRLSRSLLDEAR